MWLSSAGKGSIRITSRWAKQKKQEEGEDIENTGEISLKPAFKTLTFRVLALIIYMCLGALVFCAIEFQDNDKTKWDRKTVLLRSMLKRKYNITNEEMEKYEEAVAKRQIEYRASHHEWSYYQSLYFVSTVTTTIGYGHLTPQTQAGRLFLIVFAVVGIPINILALATVGEHITIGICFGISRLSRLCCKRRTVRHINIKVMIVSITLMVFMLFIGGALYVSTEQWTYIDSIYYCFVALATIGFGDLVPNDGQAPETSFEKALWGLRALYISIGLSLVSTVFTAISNAIEEINALLGWSMKGEDKEQRRKLSTVDGENVPGLKSRAIKLPNHITYRTAVDEMHDNLASALPMPGFRPRSDASCNSNKNTKNKLLHGDLSRSAGRKRDSKGVVTMNNTPSKPPLKEKSKIDLKRPDSSSRSSADIAIDLGSQNHYELSTISYNDYGDSANRQINIGNGAAIRLKEISIDIGSGINYVDLRPTQPRRLRSVNSSENDGYESSHCTQSEASLAHPELKLRTRRNNILDIESQISDFPYCASKRRTTSTTSAPRLERRERSNTMSSKLSWEDTNYTALKFNGICMQEGGPAFTEKGRNIKEVFNRR
ncbi:potassium channel subfamily K member 4-like isoform X2 [Rhopilema esculentum]|uniref:potassium channel subfamily K member 4-like isoform X2 n=1 Tax=Rhopilema esculentum TaxID=499914 RepID=UPI0031D4D0F3